MKKISLIALAVCSMILVSCKNNTPDKNEPEKVKFEVKLPIDGNMKVVKDGDSFVVNTKHKHPIFGDEERGITGKLTTNMEMKLVADIQRKEGTKDALCMGENCAPGNTKKEQKLEYNIPANGSDVDFHCLPEGDGDNFITYTFYPKDEPNNKLTFKINFKKS